MEIYKGGKSAKKWMRTDVINSSLFFLQWVPGKPLKLDGTIDKYGERHTQIGISLDKNDILEFADILFRKYIDLNDFKQNPELYSKIRQKISELEEAFILEAKKK